MQQHISRGCDVCWHTRKELVCVLLSSTGHEVEMCVLACREGAGVCVVFYRTRSWDVCAGVQGGSWCVCVVFYRTRSWDVCAGVQGGSWCVCCLLQDTKLRCVCVCACVCVVRLSAEQLWSVCWHREREPVKGGVVLKSHLASVIQVLTEWSGVYFPCDTGADTQSDLVIGVCFPCDTCADTQSDQVIGMWYRCWHTEWPSNRCAIQMTHSDLVIGVCFPCGTGADTQWPGHRCAIQVLTQWPCHECFPVMQVLTHKMTWS